MANSVSGNVSLDTPIGTLSFNVKCNEGQLVNCLISTHRWEPSLPKGMSVEGCYVVLLKCCLEKPLKSIKYSCEWVELKTVGHGCTGEALDAWEWESNGTLVIVGTEDPKWLNSRLGLSKEYTAENYPIMMENNKITISIEEFERNKELSLHYVISWNSLPEPKDNSCWFAVDIPHKEIIEKI
jgi:hypothetical protein